jgi:hypothetical protein
MSVLPTLLRALVLGVASLVPENSALDSVVFRSSLQIIIGVCYVVIFYVVSALVRVLTGRLALMDPHVSADDERYNDGYDIEDFCETDQESEGKSGEVKARLHEDDADDDLIHSSPAYEKHRHTDSLASNSAAILVRVGRNMEMRVGKIVPKFTRAMDSISSSVRNVTGSDDGHAIACHAVSVDDHSPARRGSVDDAFSASSSCDSAAGVSLSTCDSVAGVSLRKARRSDTRTHYIHKSLRYNNLPGTLSDPTKYHESQHADDEKTCVPPLSFQAHHSQPEPTTASYGQPEPTTASYGKPEPITASYGQPGSSGVSQSKPGPAQHSRGQSGQTGVLGQSKPGPAQHSRGQSGQTGVLSQSKPGQSGVPSQSKPGPAQHSRGQSKPAKVDQLPTQAYAGGVYETPTPLVTDRIFFDIYGLGAAAFVLMYTMDCSSMQPTLFLTMGLTALAARDVCTLAVSLSDNVLPQATLFTRALTFFALLLLIAAHVCMIIGIVRVPTYHTDARDGSVTKIPAPETILEHCLARVLPILTPFALYMVSKKTGVVSDVAKTLRRAMPTTVLIALWFITCFGAMSDQIRSAVGAISVNATVAELSVTDVAVNMQVPLLLLSPFVKIPALLAIVSCCLTRKTMDVVSTLCVIFYAKQLHVVRDPEMIQMLNVALIFACVAWCCLTVRYCTPLVHMVANFFMVDHRRKRFES